MSFGMIIQNQNMMKRQICVIIDTDSFIVSITTDDIYEDTGEDAEIRFDTSNYRILPKGKIKSNWINER